MPPSVVVRPISDDYGVDREVEVFVNGKTTGLTFKVQLKATDKSGTSRRIKRSSLEYWRSLDVPVLIVSYEAPTQTLRGRWVHSIGFEEPDSGAETITIHMDPDIGFEEVTADSLASDLTLIRDVNQGKFPVPTPVEVVVESDVHISSPQLLAGILSLSRRTRMPMRATQASEAGIVIKIERRRVRAALPLRIGSGTIHLPGPVESMGISRLAEMALVLSALAANTVNAEQARLWLSAAGPDGDWWALDGLYDRLLPLLDHPDMADLLLGVYAALVIKDEPASAWYSLPLMDRVRDVGDDAFVDVADDLRRHLSGHEEEGRLAFNLAGMYRSRQAFAEAAELYKQARRTSPNYRDDPLLLRYLGASLWEVDDYLGSAATYRRALGLGFDPFEIKPLIADSMMLAGQYAEARAELDGWEPVGVSEDRAGLLRIVMLDRLINHVGVEDQDRTNIDEQVAQAAYKAATEPHPDEAKLLAVLRDFDALHPWPWIAIVKQNLESLEFADALTLAWVLNDEAFAWVLALVSALTNEVDEGLLRAVVDQARFHCREEFYSATLRFADLQETDFADYLRELISSAYSTEFEPFRNRIRLTDPEVKGKDWIVSEEFLPITRDESW
jgi:tetratricopeptide (TPR) repeat protein